MSLCNHRSCNCALTSTSLTITGNGSAADPYVFEASTDLEDRLDDLEAADVALAADIAELKTSVIHHAFSPAGNTDAAVGVAAADWVNLGNVTVPAWATSAIVQMNVGGIHSLTGTTIAFMRTAIGTVNTSEYAIIDTTAAGKRTTTSWASVHTAPAVGAQVLKVRVEGVGPNILRADATCIFTAVVIFRG